MVSAPGRVVVAVVALAVMSPAVASGAPPLHHRVSVAGGFDGSFRPRLGGHGWFLVGYDLSGLPRGSHFRALLNTDTIHLSFDRVRLAGGWLETGASVTAEGILAEILLDYYRQGERDPARGIVASFVDVGGYLKANLPRGNYLGLHLAGRKWFFGRQNPIGGDRAAPELVLPADSWELRSRLAYTFWRLRPEPSLGSLHRPFPRVRGVAVGVEGRLHVRSDPRPWGARDPTVFSPLDPRNAPDGTSGGLRQWLRAGWQLHDRVRTQVMQSAAWGFGEDDLNRVRIGSQNPYQVPLAGTAWGAFVSERYLALQWSWHFRFWREMEAGLLADALVVADVNRRGRPGEVGFQAGIGLFADLRFGPWQIDVRVGWSPTMQWHGAAGHFNALVALGWVWERKPAPKAKVRPAADPPEN